MDEGAPLPASEPVPTTATIRPSSTCQTCGANSPGTMTSARREYALPFGKLRMTYRDESIEKHFAQVLGRHDGKGRAELEILQEVLKKPENRYLARLGCWHLDIMDTPAYVVYPSGDDYSLFIEALRPVKGSTFDVLVGEIAGVASFDECHGQQVPRLLVQTSYLIGKEHVVTESPKPEKMEEKRFESIAGDIFDRALQANKGVGTDIAKNYVFLFYLKTYTLAAQKISDGYTLLSVDAQPSKVNGPHHLTSICMNFRNRETDLTERYCCTVDQTGIFPYLADPWRQTYELSLR